MPHPTEGLGGWAGHWGGRVLEEYRVYIDTYTHVGNKITVGKKWKSLDSISDSTVVGSFTGKLNAKPACSRLDTSGFQTDLPQFLFSVYGDPIVNRTMPFNQLQS